MTGYNGNAIVRTAAGEGTGAVLYQTADGRWWKEVHYFSASDPATGVTRGTIRGNAIYPSYGG